MARSFDACVIDLTASGVDQDKARRACMAGFWAEHGMFPESADQQGLELGGDCTGYAHFAVAEMAAGKADLGPVFFGGTVSELQGDGTATLQAFNLDPEEKTPDSLLVEVQMLAPGTLIDATGKEFTFVEDDMFAYRDNFNPLDQPPVVLDHELSAKATVGRVRGLRVDDAGRLVGLWEILGAENVKPVQDKRWNRTSGRFVQSKDRSQKVVIEGSIVWSGAYNRGFGDRAQILLGRKKGTSEMNHSQAPGAAQNPPAPKAEDTPNTAAVLAQVLSELQEVKAKLAKSEQIAAESVAELVVSTETIEDLTESNPVVANLQKQVAELQAARLKDQETAALQASANQVLSLIESGKSRPEWQAKELAVLHGMPEALRPAYLELRNNLPNAWPAGPRQSVVTAQAPGTGPGSPAAQAAEEKEFAELGAEMGFAPAPAAAKGGANV